MSIKFKADRSDLFFFHQFVVGDNTSKMFAVPSEANLFSASTFFCLFFTVYLPLFPLSAAAPGYLGSASWFQENIEETNC